MGTWTYIDIDTLGAAPGSAREAFIDARGRNTMRRIVLSAATAVTVVTTAVAASSAAQADEPTGVSRVSVAYDGEPASDSSHFPVVSGDGQVVAFGSNAANIVRQDFNNVYDTFVRDLSTGVSTRVSVATDGTPANAASYGAALSYDGRFVAFYSAARNLVPGDTNNASDVFVHDRQTGTTSRVSVATDGTEANGPSQNPQLSADGRWVTFSTTATNLAPGAIGSKSKVLLHDRETGTTTEVSVRPDGTSGTEDSRLPSISADGRYVGFISSDWQIVPSPRFIATNAYVRDMQSGTTARVNATSLSSLGYAVPKAGTPVLVSPDGQYATFFTDTAMVPEDTNRAADAYRIELATGSVTRVSVGAERRPGRQGQRPHHHRRADVSRWAVRRVRQRGDEPRSRRHQRRARHLRPGHGERHHHPGQHGRGAEHSALLLPSDLGGREHRGVHHRRSPDGRRHEPPQ
nr:hypothetical protein GCM10020092_081140 [Actinoplanes digitatis]